MGWVKHKTSPPDVTIRSTDGSIILDVSFDPVQVKAGGFGGKHAFGQMWQKSSCSEIFTGIPRSSDLIIETESNESIHFTTSDSQKNYFINSAFAGGSTMTSCVKYECSSVSGGTEITTTNLPIDITRLG